MSRGRGERWYPQGVGSSCRLKDTKGLKLKLLPPRAVAGKQQGEVMFSVNRPCDAPEVGQEGEHGSGGPGCEQEGAADPDGFAKALEGLWHLLHLGTEG